MTEKQLRGYIEAHRSRDDKSAALIWGGTLGLAVGIFSSGIAAIASAALIATGAFMGRKSDARLRLCWEELDRRPPPPKPEKPAAPLKSAAAPAFNPVAAVALENDMRSMAPLRLKRKAGFAYG